MSLEKIYEELGIDKLDEEKQTEMKQYLDETVELKAKEVAENKVEEEKEKLVEQYEQKFEDYKEDITSKFSSFVDDILEKELEIPEKVKEYARLGEKYEPILENLFTNVAIDKGKIDERAKELISESSEEIEKLRNRVNDLTSKNMEVTEDAKEMASHIYLRKKCDGLTEAKKERIIKLLENVKSTEEIDRKFKILSEDSSSLNEKTMYCVECGNEVEVNEDENDATCPECGGKLSEKKKGKTNEELDEGKKPEDKTKQTQFSMRDQWLNMIKENRY